METDVSNLVSGRTGDWEVVIGMEVHAQVTSQSKLFSGSSAEFGAAACIDRICMYRWWMRQCPACCL